MTARRGGRPNSGRRAVLAGAVAAGSVTAAWAALSREPHPDQRWLRRNFHDREVSLRLGPAVGVGVLAGVAASGSGGRRAAGLAVAAAATVGAYDDLYGDRHARGLAGHVRALRHGRVTTGMVKLVTLVGVAIASSAARHRRIGDVALGTVLVAGSSNLINLFDLRPGRAAKVTVASAAMLAATGDGDGRVMAAVAAGAAAAALPADLAERAMLGDCGAGTLGLMLGLAAASSGSRARRTAIAAGVVGLTLASERVSFSAVIEERPMLARLDQLGRRPA